MRSKVIFWGIAGAVVLRILFSSIAQQLLQVIGLTLAGGLLLLFVSWKMYRQIIGGDHHPTIDEVEAGLASEEAPAEDTTFWSALWTIILADLSMSLDNVLAVAGAAGESTLVLVIGLALAIVLMAVASTYIAKLLARYPVDRLDRPHHHPLGRPRHDLSRQPQDRLRRLRRRLLGDACCRASCTAWGSAELSLRLGR